MRWAVLGDATPCRVRYRAPGAAEWHAALDLVYDARDGEHRGSLVGLRENALALYPSIRDKLWKHRAGLTPAGLEAK